MHMGKPRRHVGEEGLELRGEPDLAIGRGDGLEVFGAALLGEP